MFVPETEPCVHVSGIGERDLAYGGSEPTYADVVLINLITNPGGRAKDTPNQQRIQDNQTEDHSLSIAVFFLPALLSCGSFVAP